MENLKILCPYCNAPYTAEMLETLDICEGSYTPDCVGSKIIGKIDINCSKCKKLVYRKEIELRNTPGLEDYDFQRWQGF